MCTGNCNDTENITIASGADGEDGLFGGFSLPWNFSTSTSTNPATGTLRFNNTTYSSVTNLYINTTDNNSVDASSFLAAFSNSSNYGLIKIFKEDDSSKFWMGTITGVTNSGSYYTIAVTYITHNSSFAGNNNLVVTFTPKGATGSSGSNGTNGTNGSDGVAVLDFSTNISSHSNIAWTTYDTHTISNSQMATNGDKLKCYFHVKRTGGVYDTPSAFRVLINGTWFTADFTRGEVSGARPYGVLEMTITRTSATTASVEVLTYNKDATFIVHPQYHTYNDPTTASGVVAFNWANTTDIAFQTINDEGTSTVYGMYCLTEFYNKS